MIGAIIEFLETAWELSEDFYKTEQFFLLSTKKFQVARL